ncbi:TcpQ domain-containing protein [Variovorax sp. M-6]|uniref:TcpQ domain-containing protein n=1 Tax=Variovorax sp. M-6 TaxID=3233041 RepID=UPI003F98E8FC
MTMGWSSILLLSISLLAGCAHAQVIEQLERDALGKVGDLYDPAKTRFALARPATDRFGQLLVAGLRRRGYVLRPSSDPAAVALDYLVDEPASGIHRVTLMAGGRIIAQLFARQDIAASSVPTPGQVTPAASTAQLPRASAASQFAVSPSDTRLIPVLVRWAQEGGLVPVLDGRRVTVETLAHESYQDLPLTREARAAAGATVEQATAEILKAYAGYRTSLEVRAERRAPKFLAITTTGQPSATEPSVTLAAASTAPTVRPSLPPASPSAPAPPAPTSQPPQMHRSTASAKERFASTPPPPQIAQAPAPAVAVEPTWDFAAKKAAGVMEGAWIVGQNKSLRAVVENWAAAAGVRVVWDSPHDYPVTNAIRGGIYPGTFKVALTRLAAAFGELEVPLGMTFNTTQGKQELRVFDM